MIAPAAQAFRIVPDIAFLFLFYLSVVLGCVGKAFPRNCFVGLVSVGLVSGLCLVQE